ncbi:hypothetical protein Avbf_08942 [Armadillidium vulgare]|nr:hypothetical protein Avbf_08942 [Armadillidium vulgare]
MDKDRRKPRKTKRKCLTIRRRIIEREIRLGKQDSEDPIPFSPESSLSSSQRIESFSSPEAESNHSF